MDSFASVKPAAAQAGDRLQCGGQLVSAEDAKLWFLFGRRKLSEVPVRFHDVWHLNILWWWDFGVFIPQSAIRNPQFQNGRVPFKGDYGGVSESHPPDGFESSTALI
jgi:hypothetical protein